MTDTTQPAPPSGVWPAILTLLTSLKGYLPPSSAVWTAVLYAGLMGLGALGYGFVGPPKEVTVADKKAIEAAVAETQRVESIIADARVAAVAEKLNMDDLAQQCGNAVKEAIGASKKKK